MNITFDELSKRNYRLNIEAEDTRMHVSGGMEYFNLLEKLYSHTEAFGLMAWHHFEPYLEFTIYTPECQYSTKDVAPVACINVIKLSLQDHPIKFKIISELGPANGFFADWYIKTPEESLFSMETMYYSAKIAMQFHKHRKAVLQGKGWDRHAMRRTHVLFNQLGLTYEEEYKLLSNRALIAALLGSGLSMDKMKEQYNKLTGLEY